MHLMHCRSIMEKSRNRIIEKVLGRKIMDFYQMTWGQAVLCICNWKNKLPYPWWRKLWRTIEARETALWSTHNEHIHWIIASLDDGWLWLLSLSTATIEQSLTNFQNFLQTWRMRKIGETEDKLSLFHSTSKIEAQEKWITICDSGILCKGCDQRVYTKVYSRNAIVPFMIDDGFRFTDFPQGFWCTPSLVFFSIARETSTTK